MFKKILIANRGEISVRVIKTAQRLGIKTLIGYSDADSNSMAVSMADEAFRLGPPPAAESYLLMDAYIEAAQRYGAQAIHPGFGFLSENPEFARKIAKAGLTFIGPNPRAIEVMGDKITSKQFAMDSGVSTIPGHMELIKDAQEAAEIAKSIGFPVMLKASAGGGGKGMRIAWNEEEARQGFVSAQNEAVSSFGDDRIFIEKFIEQPRHIEIQILGDKHGGCIHLAERECSIQRRNQKVIEEAPSPFLDKKTRDSMGQQAVALAKAVDYDSAGTVEFVVDKDRNFYFLEMNTRLQVEHSVTELITGLDLVEQMIRVATGENIPFAQKDLVLNGWAMEARLYAEDPRRNFLPSTGRLSRCKFPAAGKDEHGGLIRIDTGVREGDEVSMFYDPMIAKVIGYGVDREAARKTLLRALDECYIEGLSPNTPFLSTLLMQKEFISGDLTTNYIAQKFPDGFEGRELEKGDRDLFLVAAAFIHGVETARGNAIIGRMLPPEAPPENWTLLLAEQVYQISLQAQERGASIEIDGGKSKQFQTSWRPGDTQMFGRLDGEAFVLHLQRVEGGVCRLHYRGAEAEIFVGNAREVGLLQKLPKKEPPDLSKMIFSPMPGQVVNISVSEGDEVKSGTPVCVMEAMKMENILRAEGAGKVEKIHVTAGDTVAADELLFELG